MSQNYIVGNKIKQIRLDLGLTMEQFGKLFDTSKGTVNNWEKGKNLPNKHNLKAIAKIGGITVQELLGAEKQYNIGKNIGKIEGSLKAIRKTLEQPKYSLNEIRHHEKNENPFGDDILMHYFYNLIYELETNSYINNEIIDNINTIIGTLYNINYYITEDIQLIQETFQLIQDKDKEKIERLEQEINNSLINKIKKI